MNTITQRIIIATLLILSLGAGSYFIFRTTDKEPTEPIALSTERHDWGDIAIDQLAIATFTLTNESDEEMNINKITTSCSCTKAEWTEVGKGGDKYFAPGESKIMKVTFDPQFHDDQPLGDITREVYIKIDSEIQDEIVLRLIGNLISAEQEL